MRKSAERNNLNFRALIQEATSFLETRYLFTNFEGIRYIFGKGVRCRYFRNKNSFEPPTVYISLRAKWYTYDKKSLGRTAKGIFVGIENHTILGLIHELTHHLQYENGWNTGELETTRNEIEYAKEYLPKYYNKMEIL